MPIILNPNAPPQVDRACVTEAAAQRIASAKTSQIFDEPVSGRMKSIRVSSGRTPIVRWTMEGSNGGPVDLTGLDVPGTFLRLIDATFEVDPEYGGTIVDGPGGVVEFPIMTDLIGPGIYIAEAAILDGDDVVFANRFYLIVEGSLFSGREMSGPPSIAEIRLHLRDSSPQESRLIDEFMWDDAEIAMAMTRPVQFWNEIPPPIGTHTTQSFPYRFHWIEGITGVLFKVAAESMRRNSFGYQAGGVQVDDSSKWQSYEQLGEQHWQTYVAFVRAKKVEINVSLCWGDFGSPYSYY